MFHRVLLYMYDQITYIVSIILIQEQEETRWE